MMEARPPASARRATTPLRNKNMLQPKRTKFRKAFKGRIHGDAKGGPRSTSAPSASRPWSRSDHRAPDRGGLAARSRDTSAVQAVSGSAFFPDVPVSSKPAEVRMGRARARRNSGSPREAGPHPVRADGVPGPLARVAFERAMEKLPIKTKVVARLG
jgi:large subunit ribosomal protein L16